MSTTLPHGIIQINEGNIAWYGDITANWQLIDDKIGIYDAAIATIPAPAKNGTLTINYGGTTLAMFGADDAGNVTADIPAAGDGTLTITQGGSTLGSFSANQATSETIDLPALGNGTLTVTYGGSTLGTFSANQAANSLIAIPEPGDGTLTIQKNGTNVATFTANQSTAATANITVPTAVSELTNDSGYLTASSNLDASKLTSGTVDIARLPQGALERLVKVANEAARYALTIADVQLGDTVQQLDTGIMYAVTDTGHLDSAAGYTEYTAGTAASVPWSGVTGKPTFAAVATSGAYSDLTGTPTIPTVNNATLTIQKNGKTVKTFTANASSNVTANITVPTKTSELTNDSHIAITMGTDSTSTASPAHGGTFTCIDSVTKDTNGHVTAVNVKTVTLPSDNNTDTLVTQNVSTANENHPVLLSVTKDATTNQGAKTSIFARGVKVNPSTNTVTATTFSGALSGNASSATQFSANKDVTLTGDVTGSASSKAGWSVATTLADSGVTAGTYGPGSDVTGNNNATISVPEITVDSKGRVTSVTNRTLTCKNNTYTVNNATLTIQKNGTTVKTFTANASSNVTANITVPTKTSDLTNDSGFITSAGLLPIGSYIQFAGSQAPEGFLVCNGGAVSRTTYSKLFAVIGTTYGSGDGSTTFNLPNLTDRFLQGSSTSGTVKDAGLPNITGGFGDLIGSGGHWSGGDGCFKNTRKAGSVGDPSGSAWYYTDFDFSASRSNSIYGNSDTVQPPALTCLICIKY